MKRYVLTIVILICFFAVKAQQYEKIVLGSGFVWGISVSGPDIPIYGSEYRYWSLEGDTTINGKAYNKLSFYERYVDQLHGTDDIYKTPYYGAVRQDTGQKKIYLIRNGATIEELIHAFNKSVGDTLDSIGTYLFFPRIVKNVRFDSFNSKYTLRILGLYGDELYDGIGSNHGFIEGFQEPIGWGYTLDCFGRTGYWPYKDSIGCKDILLGVNNLTIKEMGIRSYPNPVTNTLYLENQSQTEATAILYNSLGQQTHQITLQGQSAGNINFAEYKSGLYLLRWQSRHEMHVEKILKE